MITDDTLSASVLTCVLALWCLQARSGQSIKHHTWMECEQTIPLSKLSAAKSFPWKPCRYYDGINFDRRSMRVRKVLDRASKGKKFAPLVDIHTGNIGRTRLLQLLIFPTFRMQTQRGMGKVLKRSLGKRLSVFTS